MNRITEFFSEKNILSIVISIIIILIITEIIARANKKVFDKYSSLKKPPETHIVFMKHFVSGIIYVFGIGIALSVLPNFSTISKSIFAGSGILALVIGFASQHAFSNIVGGIFIAIFKPFRIGDLIRFIDKNIIGTVEDITLRHTVIKNFENKRIIIPNSVISSEIVENANIVEEKVCKFFEIGISYNSDVDKAMKIIEEEAMKHEELIDNRSDEEKQNNESPVKIRVVGYGDSSVNLKAWLWAKNNGSGFKMLWDMNYTVKKRFDSEGIEIPYPHRTVYIRK